MPGGRLLVTSREGRVSRNYKFAQIFFLIRVTSREGRVSRNGGVVKNDVHGKS